MILNGAKFMLIFTYEVICETIFQKVYNHDQKNLCDVKFAIILQIKLCI